MLAIASRPLAGGEAVGSDPALVERDLTLLGIVGLEDPPRRGAAEAVAQCRRAGIAVIMVTGDHPGTAAAVAREVGLAGPGGLVVEGRDLPADDQVLGALVDHDGAVVARASRRRTSCASPERFAPGATSSR